MPDVTPVKMLPGIALVLAVAIVAYVLGRFVPVVGGPVFAIVIGMAVASIRKPSNAQRPGISFSSKQLLQTAIVLLGANLGLSQLAYQGAHALPVMLGTLAIVLAAAYVLGKAFGIERDMRRLLGVGTAICGGSAIAAVSSVIGASEADIAYSISVVFLFNVVAVLIFPAIGHALALSQHAFGLWAGTAINDTSSVVAAAYTYGKSAGDDAVITKLTRTTLIIPIVLFYAGKRLWAARASSKRVNVAKIVPWFIVWFVAAAALNSFGAIPAAAHAIITPVALFLVIVALGGVGLSADFAQIHRAGVRPIVLGALLWIAIAVSAMVFIRVGGLG